MQPEVISSSKNPVVKQLRQLMGSAHTRKASDLAVAEGIHLVDSLLRSGGRLESLIYAESARNNLEVKQLIKLSQSQARQHIVLKDSLFEAISRLHAGVGVLAVFEPSRPALKSPLIEEAILLEAVQDPGNLGMILRSVAAAGFQQAYLSVGTASAWSPKALRAGMGAQFSLRVYEQVDLIELVKASQLPVLATDLSGSESIYQAELSQPFIWLFGNEGQGVSSELLSLATSRLNIPQAASAVESLNVSAAVAVCLFEQRRQRLQNI